MNGTFANKHGVTGHIFFSPGLLKECPNIVQADVLVSYVLSNTVFASRGFSDRLLSGMTHIPHQEILCSFVLDKR